jgi:hypothetical protein
MTKFKPGQSGNPGGRPKGSYTKQLTVLREAADKVLPLLIDKALAGDMEAMRLIVDRAIPKAKPLTPPEAFLLPEGNLLEQVQAVLRQVAAGELSPSAASEIVGIVATAAKVEEIDSLRAELNSLKCVLERRNK